MKTYNIVILKTACFLYDYRVGCSRYVISERRAWILSSSYFFSQTPSEHCQRNDRYFLTRCIICLLGIVHMDRTLLTLTDFLSDPHGHPHTFAHIYIYISYIYIYIYIYTHQHIYLDGCLDLQVVTDGCGLTTHAPAADPVCVRPCPARTAISIPVQ